MATITLSRGSFKYLIVALTAAWFAVFLCRYVDLARTDIGRHLKNGELICQDFSLDNFSLDKPGILNSNYYSYTHPEFPVVNHHWGSGVIFHVIWKLSGFTGLSLFYIIISVLTFLLFFDLARRKSGYSIAVLIAVLLIPVMAERKEIRPELISYLFCGLFYWILSRYNDGGLSRKWLFVLPVLELIWVNTHIYFIFGYFIICAFIAEALLRKSERIKDYFVVLTSTVLVSVLNPFGVKGVIYPFGIFKNYGYKIVENQSVPFLENYGIVNSNFLVFKVSFFLLALSFLFIFVVKPRKFPVTSFILGITFGIMSWLALRNFTMFGFFALPVISGNLREGFSEKIKFDSKSTVKLIAVLSLIVFAVNVSRNYQNKSAYWKSSGVGLVPGNEKAAEFFKALNIQGPIINNYDIGGYLIYHLFPQHRVYTDNRPEAYPVSFFQEVYIPLQESTALFRKFDKEQNFNCIFFSYHDLTPWGQSFLIQRVNDDAWAPVFADNYAIIFLKRNGSNKEIIDKHEVPRERFNVRR